MFNYGEFATIKSHAGLNNFKISVKEFVERTNAISLQARAGRYGGTYAHKDIAFEFAMWISPEFKIYIVRIPETKRRRAETTWMECQAGTCEDQLPHSHRCDKAESYSTRGHSLSEIPDICR